MNSFRATYDLGTCPASWDFLQWLINVEIERRKSGSGSLQVDFEPGPKDGFRDDNLPRPLDQRKAILENVMRPALDLIGATECTSGHPFKSYLPRYAVDAAKEGIEIPKWHIPHYATIDALAYLNGRKPITITLREASYFPDRNSNVEAWTKFAKTCGEDVIFIRDTAKADQPLDGFETCPRASKDLHFRIALMSLAKCNLMVASGPAMMSYYSDYPWLMFGPLTPQLPSYTPGSVPGWGIMVGLLPGQQFPWSRPDQRIIWERDSLVEINRAWAEFNGKEHEIGTLHTRAAVDEETRQEYERINCARFLDRVRPDAPANDRIAQLFCFGPSLKDTWSGCLHNEGTDIITVSGAHDFLVDRSIIPDFHIECDPRSDKNRFITKPQKTTKYLIASCVHPGFFDQLEGHEVKLWHSHNGKDSEVLMDTIDPGSWMLSGGGSVGLRAINLLYIMGYRTFFIHGMDCSFREEQHAGPHPGKVVESLDVRCGSKTYKSSTAFVSYARDFMVTIGKLPSARFQMYGDGLLQHMCRVAQEAPATVENAEIDDLLPDMQKAS